MSAAPGLEDTGAGLRHAARVVASLAAGGAMAYLLLVSVLLAVVRCGDSCPSASAAEHWRWTAQLVPAVLGVGTGAASLVLGFTSRVCASRVLLAVAAALLGGWGLWVVAYGRF